MWWAVMFACFSFEVCDGEDWGMEGQALLLNLGLDLDCKSVLADLRSYRQALYYNFTMKGSYS